MEERRGLGLRDRLVADEPEAADVPSFRRTIFASVAFLREVLAGTPRRWRRDNSPAFQLVFLWASRPSVVERPFNVSVVTQKSWNFGLYGT